LASRPAAEGLLSGLGQVANGAEDDPAVAADDEGYYLSFTVPQELIGDGGGLHNAASVLLRRVNGVARTLGSDVRPWA
jgi:hypothetical protein